MRKHNRISSPEEMYLLSFLISYFHTTYSNKNMRDLTYLIFQPQCMRKKQNNNLKDIKNFVEEISYLIFIFVKHIQLQQSQRAGVCSLLNPIHCRQYHIRFLIKICIKVKEERIVQIEFLLLANHVPHKIELMDDMCKHITSSIH